MDVSIIIINWNSKEYLRKCLRSFQSVSSKLSMETIVVDNASHDGCGEMLAKEFPSAIFVQSAENLGFARGNNLGASRATGRNLWFLNPDTELLEDSVSTLVSRLDSIPGAGAVGCKLLNSDKTLQTSCVQSFPSVLNQFLDSDFLRSRFPRSRLWGTSVFLSDDPRPQPVEAVSGAGVMIKSSVFRQIQGFTQSYFMYGEDLDLCFKVKRAGYEVYYLPETSMLHHGGTSTRKAKSDFSNVMMRESVFRFLRLHRGLASALGYRVAMAANSGLRLFLILPLLLAGNRIVKHGTGSLQKWFAILRWSLGFDRLAAH
ncbi:MAG TPA: glycosyltransferase family 2 protein [Verrucomicrobiae bacterium]|nr:glycosyltransferase family 2 protein [Verrucomicrobiae bacterium]